MIYVSCSYRAEILHGLNEKSHKVRVLTDVGDFFNFGYYACYCVGHWIFAFKYWCVAYKLENELPECSYYIIYVGIVVNILIPAYKATMEALNWYKQLDHAYLCLIFVQIISAVVMFDGCRRIA